VKPVLAYLQEDEAPRSSDPGDRGADVAIPSAVSEDVRISSG
jgi:hypothetical protein